MDKKQETSIPTEKYAGFLKPKKKRVSSKLLASDPRLREKTTKYSSGKALIKTKRTKDPRVRQELERLKEIQLASAVSAAAAEILMPATQGFVEADEGEVSYTVTQKEILEQSDMQTNQKAFELTLNQLGPYSLNYTRNGRFLLLGGMKGHIALIEWQRKRLIKEFQVNETIHDVKFLHNDTMFAVAQKKHAFIYDKTGVELHCLKETTDPRFLQFLPYHFLLVIANQHGRLRYLDISTGTHIVEHNTKQGISCVTQNPRNAIILCGNQRGVVTMWSPNQTSPIVKILTHNGANRSLAVDHSGNYLVTSGNDGFVKVWDVRTYRALHQYTAHTHTPLLSLSQTNVLAVSTGKHIQIWKDALVQKQAIPYLHDVLPGRTIHSIEFCPYEDFLGIGHSMGFKSMVVPGAGSANFDSFEANPFQTKKQRQESEVHSLLEKIPSTMISMNPNVVGTVDESHERKKLYIRELSEKANNPDKPKKIKNKARGKNSSMKRYLKKHQNVIDEKRLRIEKELKLQKLEETKLGTKKKQEKKSIPEDDKKSTALDIFKKKEKQN